MFCTYMINFPITILIFPRKNEFNTRKHLPALNILNSFSQNAITIFIENLFIIYMKGEQSALSVVAKKIVKYLLSYWPDYIFDLNTAKK